MNLGSATLRWTITGFALTLASLAAAHSTVDQHLSSIAGFVEIGQNGAWTSDREKDDKGRTKQDDKAE